MTLVISIATPGYGLHVSDRLVSRAGSPYDAYANKTVVFRATDGLIVFGYTGPAFLDGVPTDTWIADVLSGGACAAAAGGLMYGAFDVRDTGSSLATLSQRLRAGRVFDQYGGEVCAAGWQWNARRRRAYSRPVLWALNRDSGPMRWTQHMPRHLPERKTEFRMCSIGDWPLGPDAWNDLVARTGSAGPNLDSVEQLAVSAIRNASAQRSGTIGGHCMSVVVRPGHFHPNARVRFLPAERHQGQAFGQEVELAFTPWMVSPDTIHAPAVTIGGLNCQQGLLTYAMEMPEPPTEQIIKAAFQRQERPPSA